MPIYYIRVAIAHRAGTDARQVAACAWLGHGNCANQRAIGEAGQPACLRRRAGIAQDVGNNNVVVDGHANTHKAAARQFFYQHGVVAVVVQARTTVLLRHIGAEEARATGSAPQLAWDAAMVLPGGVV